MKAIASIFVLGSALVVASTVFAAEPSSQPLTRADCDKAGMGWDEGANVCVPNAEGSKAAGSKAQTAPKAKAASKEKNASKPKAALKAATPPAEKHVYKKKNKHAASKKKTHAVGKKKTHAASKTKKRAFHARQAHYKHPQQYQPVERRPFRWLFRNPNRPPGAS
jgi:hypothetical protein